MLLRERSLAQRRRRRAVSFGCVSPESRTAIISNATGKANRLAAALAAAALLAWAALLARALDVFAPDSVHVQTFNSDSALPVLMANDPVIDPFRFYVYGQDQVGAWPFLLCQLISRATGHVWTDTDIYLFHAGWLFLSAFAVAALARGSRLAAPALLVATLCLHPAVARYLFVINQRNAWQVTAIFFAWWSLRRVCAHHLDATSPDSEAATGVTGRSTTRAAGRSTTRAALWSLSAFAFSLLAAWTSPLSGPPLLAIYALELLRARALARSSSPARANVPGKAPTARRTITSILMSAAPLVAALACEQLLKANFHRHALKHYGNDFRTPVELDWGHMTANLQAQVELFLTYPQWPLTALAALAAPALLYQLARRATRAVRAEAANGGRASRVALAAGPLADETGTVGRESYVVGRESYSLVRPGLRLDLSVLALGCLSVAAVNLASTVVFSWPRLNSYGPRYLALTHLFGTLAGLLTLLLLFSLPAKVYAARRKVFPALAAAAVLLVALLFPPAAKDPEYAPLKEVAEGLTRRAPRAVLLGGYWDTYVFPALSPRDAVVPVPAANQLLRTPWTPQALREAEHVVVVHHVFPPRPEIETPAPYTDFGDGGDPPAVIQQHGATLRLLTPRFYEQHGYTFSLYRNERPQAR